jgi:hypothetical protein
MSASATTTNSVVYTVLYDQKLRGVWTTFARTHFDHSKASEYKAQIERLTANAPKEYRNARLIVGILYA